MYVATKSIYRTYCGFYPFSSDFKAFSLSIGRNKEQRRRNKITCITFLLFFLYFRFMTSKDVFEITKPLT